MKVQKRIIIFIIKFLFFVCLLYDFYILFYFCQVAYIVITTNHPIQGTGIITNLERDCSVSISRCSLDVRRDDNTIINIVFGDADHSCKVWAPLPTNIQVGKKVEFYVRPGILYNRQYVRESSYDICIYRPNFINDGTDNKDYYVKLID